MKVDLAFTTPRQNHNAIELHAATIAWDGDQLTIHDASQLVTATAATIAGVLDLDARQVRVLSPYVGGGFASSPAMRHRWPGRRGGRARGRARQARGATRFESYASILRRAGRNEVSVQAEAPMPLELQKWSMHSTAAQFCEVRVSDITGVGAAVANAVYNATGKRIRELPITLDKRL